MTDIRLARNAGFCFGVKRAMLIAQEAAARSGPPVVTFGPLIHNDEAVAFLAQKGIGVIERQEDGEGKRVVIRSHGASPDVIKALAESGAEVIDATCPCVAAIQKKAAQRVQEGAIVVIAGEKGHPEVAGVIGCTNGAAIAVADASEAEALPEMECACLMAQTTFTSEKFEQIRGVIERKAGRVEVVDSICGASGVRQQEARELAEECDVMIVVGDPGSANSRHLAEICKGTCRRTYFVRKASELPPREEYEGKTIGITAGASTPEWIIKEVVTAMSDLDRTEQNAAPVEQAEPAPKVAAAPKVGGQESFMEAFEKTLVSIRTGQTITGTVVQVTDEEVCVNIGYKSDGVIKRDELVADIATVSVGSEIEVEVVKVNDGEGNVVLSQRNIVTRRNWDELVKAFEAGELIEGVGKEVVKGGLIATVRGIRTFVPASQLSERYVEKMEQFIGQPMKLKIIEVDRPKKRLVASRKQVLAIEAEMGKKKAWENLEPGKVIKGTVRRLTDFGAFVDIGGVDGLIHVTDLSWGRVKHPSEVVRIGEEVEVKILSLDQEKERIGLGLKQTRQHPWEVALQNYTVGAIFSGKVVRIVSFGAFVELEPGLDGLVHISHIAPQRINRVEDALQIGDIVNVKVLEVNPEQKRISLSIRQAYEEMGAYDMPAEEEVAVDPAEAADAVEEKVQGETPAADETTEA